MNEQIKQILISRLAATYPGVLFISVNVAAHEMQLHYQNKVITDIPGELNFEDNTVKMFLSMLGFSTVEKIHIFMEQKIVTIYGNHGTKKVNL